MFRGDEGGFVYWTSGPFLRTVRGSVSNEFVGYGERGSLVVRQR